MFNKSSRLLVLFAVFAVFGCSRGTEKNSPQGTLSDYVTKSFAVKASEDRAKLLELTAEQAHEALKGLDEGSSRQSFINEKKEFVSLKIRDERKLEQDRYSITYELTYVNTSGELKDKITNKKHALFVNKNGKWLITEVRNIKTYIEHQNEMSITP